LFQRARNLLPEGSDERAAIGPDLTLALQEVGENDEAMAVADEAARASEPIVRARGAIARADLGYFLDDEAQRDIRIGAEDARMLLEEAGDDLGLAQYWRVQGFGMWARLQADAAREAWERGLMRARAADARRLEVELEGMILSALVLGPTPVERALPYAENVLRQSPPGSLVEASAQRAVGKLRSCQGLFDEGRELHARGRQTYREAGLQVTAAGWTMSESEIEWRANDLEAQERILRGGVEVLDALGDHFFFSTVALRLVDCLLLTRTPDDEEITRIVAAARERTLAGDLVNFVYLDGIEARRLVRAGSAREGVALARKAVETADTTDNFEVRSYSWYALAETCLLAGEPDEAARAASRSIEIRIAKGDVAGTAALERRYADLGLKPA
jgi:tetratricopeptide (TPR) repeat protein